MPLPPIPTKALLSASTNGQGILVSATATPGTLIHTSTSTADTFDEIWIWAVNRNATNRTLTIEWGTTGTTASIEKTIAGDQGLILVIPGLILRGGATVRAFVNTGTDVTLFGYVNALDQVDS